MTRLAVVLTVLLMLTGCAMFVPQEQKQAAALDWAAVHSLLERWEGRTQLDEEFLANVKRTLEALDWSLWCQLSWMERRDPEDVPKAVRKLWGKPDEHGG